MPTFTAITLDRLLEAGASNSMAAGKDAPDLKMGRRNTPNEKLDRTTSVPNYLERRNGAPIPRPESRNGASVTKTAMNKRHHWAQPALYATPKSAPLPDSPSSFPPSPYIVNHKRRGPRLLKSSSEDDVVDHKKVLDGEETSSSASNAENKASNLAKDDNFTSVGSVSDSDLTSTVPSPAKKVTATGFHHGEHGSSDFGNDVHNGEHGIREFGNGSTAPNGKTKSVAFGLQADAEMDDFFDPQDSLSVKSNSEAEGSSGFERSTNIATPMAEFYDAWEDLSSENGLQQPLQEIETELREIKSSLLVEIDKRKLAEDALSTMRSQWLRIHQQLFLVGLTLPADPTAVVEDGRLHDPAEDLCQQVQLARLVSNSIGRGIAKAEAEMAMEAQLELKNFEISRLLDRLHYYEAVNQQMSQRNQEAVEMARRLRQRKRRRKWIWGSIAAAVTLGTAALAWSYLPSGRGGTSSSNQSSAPDGDPVSER